MKRYMSDLESWLYNWEIKINTENGTVVTFTKGRQVPRIRLKLFEQEIPWSAEATYNLSGALHGKHTL
jgi:hypothetical protein